MSSACTFCSGDRRASADESELLRMHQEHKSPLLEAAYVVNQIQHTASIYNALDHLEPWQIRILELQPSHDQEQLVARLFNADLLFDGGVVESCTRTRQEYSAISYYWGADQERKYSLDCNGVTCPISREAYLALYRVRDLWNPVCLWIDTLCIDQNDSDERSNQVAKMRSIYQNANKVVVYLGEYTRSGQASFGNDRSAMEWILGLLVDHELNKVSICGAFPSLTDWVKSREPGSCVCDSHADLLERGLREIASLKWFSRVWIKQEVWAARLVELRVGHSILGWETLKSLPGYMELLVPHLSSYQRSILEPFVEEITIKLKRLVIGTPVAHAAAGMDDKPNPLLRDDEEHQQDIVNVFRRAVHAECSCVHDRVFGLLGMTSVNIDRIDKTYQNRFAVSYIEHPTEMFARLALYIICRDHSLNILFLDLAFPRPQDAGEINGQKLPSWVPDWRYEIGHVERPSRSCWINQNWSLPVQNRKGILRVQGYTLGTVASRTDRRPINKVELEWEHTWLQYSSFEEAETPVAARRFDLVALLEGARGPVLIRPCREPSTYVFIGPIFPLRGYKQTFSAITNFVNKLTFQPDIIAESQYFNLI